MKTIRIITIDKENKKKESIFPRCQENFLAFNLMLPSSKNNNANQKIIMLKKSYKLLES